MSLRIVRRSWVVLFFLAVAAAEPLDAQLSEVSLRLHGGIIQPIAGTGDYFKFGPSVGVDFAYPLRSRLGVLLDLGWDYLNMTDIYATPHTNLWRYGLGVEADLRGDPDASFMVKALAGAGATTIRSHKFWLDSRRPYTFEGETINQTSLTATGGVRLGLHTSSDDLTWWLTGKVNWLPLQETNQDALRELSRNQLDPLGSALSASITIGITVF